MSAEGIEGKINVTRTFFDALSDELLGYTDKTGTEEVGMQMDTQSIKKLGRCNPLWAPHKDG
jgi:hypothetical protein